MMSEIYYRWHAVVTYSTDSGPLAVEHDMQELEELHDLVEAGPCWSTIIDIRITFVGTLARQTVEQAACA
jgi:hypothetical protein